MNRIKELLVNHFKPKPPLQLTEEQYVFLNEIKFDQTCQLSRFHLESQGFKLLKFSSTCTNFKPFSQGQVATFVTIRLASYR